MPSRRKFPRSTRRTTKRYYKRKRYRKSTVSYIRDTSALIPKRVFHKFNYFTTLDFATGAVAKVPSIYEFRTSLFDPDFTGGGHQPYLHDQWGSFYSYYRVYGIKFNIQFLSTTSTVASMVWVARNSYTTISSTDPEVNEEFPTCYAKRAINSSKPVTIKGFMSVAKTEGLTRREFLGDAGYEAAIGANPTKYSRLSIGVQSDAPTQLIVAYVSLQLYAELWGQILPAKS